MARRERLHRNFQEEKRQRRIRNCARPQFGAAAAGFAAFCQKVKLFRR